MLPVSSVWEVTSLFGLASLPQHQQYAHDPDRDSVELELDRESRSTFCNNIIGIGDFNIISNHYLCIHISYLAISR